jgi:hypothetical protein
MISRIPQKSSDSPILSRLVTIEGVPPKDPPDDNDENEEGGEDNDEDDDEDEEPIIREPDEC